MFCARWSPANWSACCKPRSTMPSGGLGGHGIDVPPAILERIALFSNGDARVALRTLETVVGAASGGAVTERLLEDALQRKLPRYDKSGEEHFNLISALHKSIRSSDPDAALYWLARMFEGGEDRLYIGRRLARIAAEDIGLADPRALEQTMAAVEAFRFTGEPEGDLYLAQAAVYLALAPKSDAAYKALAAAQDDVRRAPGAEVPLRLRNAPTKLMSELGYAQGYEHAHERPDALPGMACLPDPLQGQAVLFSHRPRRGGTHRQASGEHPEAARGTAGQDRRLAIVSTDKSCLAIACLNASSTLYFRYPVKR